MVGERELSKALEIASERYARGEITKEEFEDIKSSLRDDNQTTPIVEQPSTNGAVGQQPEQQQEFQLTKDGWFFWLIPMVVVIPLRWNLPGWDQMGGLSQIAIIIAIICMCIGIAKVTRGK